MLHVAVGARCIIVRNLFIESGLYNGALCTISEILTDKDEDGFPLAIFVKPDQYYGPRFSLRSDIPVCPIEFPEYDPVSKQTFIRRQYPIELSFGITIHKSQVSKKFI